MVTIVDDHCRATWTFLISCKSQTLSIITKCIKMVAVHFHKNIQTPSLDNGTEFCNTAFQSLLAHYDILHQRSCVYTPQQNGVVERKHKHLLQSARALLFQSSLPKFFWDHALLLATFLINRLPSFILDWKTPYEILYNKPPDYSVLCCFRCLCYATDIQPHKDKFSPQLTNVFSLVFNIVSRHINCMTSTLMLNSFLRM